MKSLKQSRLAILLLALLPFGGQISHADDANTNPPAKAPVQLGQPESRQAAHHDVSPPLRNIRPIKPTGQRRTMHSHKIHRGSQDQNLSAPSGAPTEAGSKR